MRNTIKVPLIKQCSNIYIFATKTEKINFPSHPLVYKQFSGLCLTKQINDYSRFCEHLQVTKKTPVAVCACAYAHTCSLMVFALASNGSGIQCTKWIILLKESSKSRAEGEVIWHTA